MAKKKKGGRPKNWQEICMERVPPGVGKPPEPVKVEAKETKPKLPKPAS